MGYLNTNDSVLPRITTYYQGFPQSMIFTFDISSIAGVFLYGFVCSLLMPVFIANLVTDKQEKVLLMMQMSGLHMSIYWLVAYIYDMFLYGIVALVIYLTSYIFKMRLFTQTNPALLIIYLFLWGNVLISLCFLFSTFFSKSRTASVAGYLIVIISVVVSNLLNTSVFLAKFPPWYYMIYPPFAFYRGVFDFEEACIDLMCFQWDDLYTVRPSRFLLLLNFSFICQCSSELSFFFPFFFLFFLFFPFFYLLAPLPVTALHLSAL